VNDKVPETKSMTPDRETNQPPPAEETRYEPRRTDKLIHMRNAFKLMAPISFTLLFALVALSGCQRDASNARRYELNGKVMTVEKDKHLVTVSHEDIKGLMAGMTMPFVVREEWVFDQAAAGDQITATLVVDETESWLENVVIVKSNTAPGASGPPGVVVAKAGDDVPDFALVNQSNKPIRTAQYKGKTLLLTFIYTRCPLPEYCTLMSTNFAQIDQQLQKRPELYEKTRLLSISIDPEYDTPAVLRSYGASHTGRFGDETFSHWAFATGTKEQVRDIAQFFGLHYYPQKDQIIHGLRTVIIAPDGKVYKVYPENKWKPEEVLQDLEIVSH
jgi:protein SCO1